MKINQDEDAPKACQNQNQHFSMCYKSLLHPQFETGWLHLKASWIWARNGTNHRHLFLARKWQLLFDTYLLSYPIYHFIRISHESWKLFSSPMPREKIHHNMILAYFPVFNLWIYGSDDYQLLLTASQNLIASIHTTFCWLHEVTCPSTLAQVTSHGIYDCQVNSKWCCNCELKKCFRIMSTDRKSAIWCNRSFPSVKCVWSTVWWSHVLRKLAHVYSPPCKSAGAKRWGMRGQAWNSWFDWLNLYDSTRRMPKDIQTWKSSILRSLTLRILDSRGRFWGDQLSLPTRDVRKLSMFTWQSTMILYNTNQQAFKMMWYVDV